MFKLVIVEDEDNIRHSLECFIPWEEMGFRVVNTFSDGSDALAYLKNNPCDAILTDILMSRMSGLEMIRDLHEIHPQIKVVILSGHSDFSYAQQAIAYKVEHYLVKPVDEDELIAVFKGIAEQLAYEGEELAVTASETRELRQMLQKTFFRDLLSGHIGSDSELGVYLKLLGIEALEKDSRLLAFEIKASKEEHSALAQEADAVSVEYVFEKCVIPVSNEVHAFLEEEGPDRWHVVFVGAVRQENESLKQFCYCTMQELMSELNNLLSYEFTFNLTHSVEQISDLLTDAKGPLELQEPQMDGVLCETVVSDYKLLVIELDLNSRDTLCRILGRLVRDLRDTPLEDARFIFKNLYSLIEMNYKKRKINTWDITNGKFNFNHLYQAQSVEDIANCLVEDFSALCDGLKKYKRESEHSVIGRIVQYLDEHVDEDVGHDVIAARYRMHPGYLSRLFKQEMGETLSEYLLRTKMERAADLLKQGQYKVGEIAAMVGYSAPSYFSIMFKKHTGYSPREYSQRISL